MSYSPIAANAITQLTGDISALGPGSAIATVNDVGGQTASAVAFVTGEVMSATSLNIANTLMLRDVSGNVYANFYGQLVGSLIGNVTGNLTGNSSGHSALDLALSGGTMSGTLNMGNQTISNVANASSSNDAVNLAQTQSIANSAAQTISILNALVFG